MNECTIEGCTEPVRVIKRGLCTNHYQVWARKNKPRGTRPCSIEGCGKHYYAKNLCRRHYNLLKTTGHVEGIRSTYEPVPCPNHPHKVLNSQGNCSACQALAYYWNGPKNGPRLDRRKEFVGYEGLHARLRYDRGRAAEYQCQDCSKQATDWSLKHDAESVITATSGRSIGCLYSLNVMDYEPRCQECHKRYDALHQNKKVRNPYRTYFRDRRKQAA